MRFKITYPNGTVVFTDDTGLPGCMDSATSQFPKEKFDVREDKEDASTPSVTPSVEASAPPTPPIAAPAPEPTPSVNVVAAEPHAPPSQPVAAPAQEAEILPTLASLQGATAIGDKASLKMPKNTVCLDSTGLVLRYLGTGPGTVAARDDKKQFKMEPGRNGKERRKIIEVEKMVFGVVGQLDKKGFIEDPIRTQTDRVTFEHWTKSTPATQKLLPETATKKLTVFAYGPTLAIPAEKEDEFAAIAIDEPHPPTITTWRDDNEARKYPTYADFLNVTFSIDPTAKQIVALAKLATPEMVQLYNGAHFHFMSFAIGDNGNKGEGRYDYNCTIDDLPLDHKHPLCPGLDTGFKTLMARKNPQDLRWSKLARTTTHHRVRVFLLDRTTRQNLFEEHYIIEDGKLRRASEPNATMTSSKPFLNGGSIHPT